MKYIELDQETEKLLVEICDAALKAAGFAAYGKVHQLVSRVKEMPKPVEEVK